MLTNENIADCDEMETIIQTPAALTTKQGKQWRLFLIWILK